MCCQVLEIAWVNYKRTCITVLKVLSHNAIKIFVFNFCTLMYRVVLYGKIKLTIELELVFFSCSATHGRASYFGIK